MADTNPMTGRTPAEERLVTWDYYLGMAANLMDHHKARDLLEADGYRVADQLRDLQRALSWPTPSDEAIALATRHIGPEVS